MRPYYQDNSVTIFNGDVLSVLPTLPAESVHCVITSPPYWGLRDYGTAQWEGGDEGCDHLEQKGTTRGGPASTITGGQDISPHNAQYKQLCAKCGARRIDSQLGLESTPEQYVAKMVQVFREVKRVLRNDGTLWCNLGDSYAGSWGNYHPNSPPGKHGQRLKETARWNRPAYSSQDFLPPTANCGLKPKDLVGIPWRVAFALQADGWYLRSDIIWHKPNPMPESVTDRPTKAHEYLFLLAKSEHYYYDAEAIKEAAIYGDPRKPYAPGQIDARGNGHDRNGGTIRPSVLRGGFNGKTEAMADEGRNAFRSIKDFRNRRSVWTVPTQPYPEAHFATFPEDLVKPCVMAGCPMGGTVLDPFSGAGTALFVAKELGRKAIGVELKSEYIDLASARMAQEVLDLCR